ncbi:hypothetical protein BsWGS_15854 [Bradybaena similaris]
MHPRQTQRCNTHPRHR